VFRTKHLFFSFFIGILFSATGPYQGLIKPIIPSIYTLKPFYRNQLNYYPPATFFKNPFTRPSWPDQPYNQALSFIAIQEAAQKASSQAASSIENIIQYEAKDSITFDLEEKNFNLYGAGAIGYEDMKLDAENLTLNWATNTLTATGKQNEAGEFEKKPVFTQGNTKYIAEEIRYNIDSKRGTARKLITKQDDAIIHCNKAKIDKEDTYYTDDMQYTTCNLIKPHYHVRARNVKFVQGKKVSSGPFQFYFDNVPTPLGFFYGLFFIPQPKISGVLPPKLGEDPQHGFYMRDGGYYFYFNDYIDLALRGALYSKGSSNISAQSTYKKRYSYAGELSYEHKLETASNELALHKEQERSWRFTWRHSTQNNRVSSLMAEVDIQSQSFNRNRPQYDADKLNASTNSRVKYTNNLIIGSLIGLPHSLSSSVAHSKNFKTNITNLTLPEVILTTGHIYPLRRKSKNTGRWYQDVYFKHTFEIKNEITNVIGKDTLDISQKNLPRLFKEGKYGAKHTVPIETNIKLFQYFNFKPKFQYQERWYWKSIDYQYDANNNTILQDTVSGFKRVWDYNWGANLQTTLYGTHFFGSEALVQAFRHQLEPSIGFTYTPDFSKEKFGYWQKLPTKDGEKLLDKFDKFIYGGPKNRASAVLDFKIDNSLDTKIKNLANPNEKPKKVPILETFSLGSSYDFLADSFKLSDIKLAARTRILDSLISIEYNANFDPYIYKDKKRVEEFAWHHGQGIGYIKTSSLRISTTLQSSKYNNNLNEDKLSQAQPEISPLLADSLHYVDFNLPWQLRLTFDRRYTYQPEYDKKDIRRSLSFSGDTSLTEKWKVGFDSTYDIDKKELVGSATKLSIYRDLHCWQMNFDWRPLGEKQSYEFSIGIKAPILQDIKYPRSNEYKKL
jgi:hypothetical protein